jgi:hypothetical protein
MPQTSLSQAVLCYLHRCFNPIPLILHPIRLTLLKCSGYRLLCLFLPLTLHCANNSSMRTTPMQLLWRRKLQKVSTTDGYQWQNDLLLHKLQVYVPHSLRLDVLRMHYDDPLSGHFGIARTLELLSRNYWFPSMSSFVKQYVSTCDICSRGKPSRHLKHGELMPLPVPPGPWKGVTCNFVTDLPISNGHDSLLVFVDRFMKMCHIIPCNNTTDIPQFACMFLNHVVCLHGLPDSLVSDPGSIFTSRFWKCLSQLLSIKGRLSTAFHPQTDGQTERMNQTIEQYLCIYCNY